MSTRELVDALVAGDSIAIEDTFGQAMSQKISLALDNYKMQVAQNMFASKEQSGGEEVNIDDNAQ